MTGVVEGIEAVSGLAGLFNTAITWFDYVLVAKQAAPRLQSLLVKLDATQLRLTRWGKAAGLTGSQIEDEESLKNSGSFQLDESEEKLAVVTFQAVADLFEQCQKLCHDERKGKSKDGPSARENEVSPFSTVGLNWNPMHRYLHGKMQDIADGRKDKVLVAQRCLLSVARGDRYRWVESDGWPARYFSRPVVGSRRVGRGYCEPNRCPNGLDIRSPVFVIRR